MRPLAWALLFVAGLVWACTTASVPGDENLGVYSLAAVPAGSSVGGTEVSCLLNAGASYDFDVTLSRNANGSGAWMTISGVSRDASWDGQVFGSTAAAPRVFPECEGCTTNVVETIELALLSASQAASLGSACPPNPLDGGVPAADPDAGITAPGSTDSGFDAMLACGALRATLEWSDAGSVDAGDPDASVCPAACRQCTVHYDVTGSRR